MKAITTKIILPRPILLACDSIRSWLNLARTDKTDDCSTLVLGQARYSKLRNNSAWSRRVRTNSWCKLERCESAEHLQLFSRAGGRELLTAVGLRQVRVVTEGFNPFELLKGLRGPSEQTLPDANSQPGNARVETSYRLNESLMASPSRGLLKKTLHGLLNFGRLGDSLKIWAEK